jgi:hypothetical protein
MNRIATFTIAIKTGTSTSGPITVAKATDDPSPKAAMATAIASSKLFAGGGEGCGGCLAVICAYHFSHDKADKKHDHKIDRQRNGNADNIHG